MYKVEQVVEVQQRSTNYSISTVAAMHIIDSNGNIWYW